MVKNSIVAGALAVGAFVAGVLYLKHDPATQSPASMQSAPDQRAKAESAPPAASAPRSAGSGRALSEPRRTDSTQMPADPRLAALMVSPDNGLIEFVRAANGKVIAEIDQDPSSLGFKKPLREYIYSRDKVVGLTAYRYLPEHTEISRTSVSYKPDGSVDQYAESTSYDSGRKK